MATIVYSKNNCSACKRTKILLKAMGAAFEERNVEEDEIFMQEARATGFSSMPIIITDEEVISGFQPDKLEDLFGEL